MLVSATEFPRALATLTSLLPHTTCISFDLEFTGLSLPGSHSLNTLSTPQHRYKQMWKPAIDNYTMIQVGICLYCPNAVSTSSLTAHPFTFFTKHPTADLNMSGSAVEFLAKNNMDWNTWLGNAAPFCDKATADNALAKHHKQYPPTIETDSAILETINAPKTNQRPPQIPNTAADHQYLSLSVAAIRGWLDTDSRLTLHLPPTSPYRRLLVHGNLESTYPTIVREGYDGIYDLFTRLVISDNDAQELARQPDFDPTRLVRGRGILLSRLTDEAKVVRYKEDRDKSRVRVNDKVLGFRQVWEAIKDEVVRRPEIIMTGHNCTLDILYLMKCLEGPLPDDLNKLFQDFHKMFPNLMDTKMLGDEFKKVQGEYDNSNLGGSFEAIESATIRDSLDKEHNVDVDLAGDLMVQKHDAGYDAYMTGVICLRLKAAHAKCVNSLYYMRSLGSMQISSQGFDFVLKGGALSSHVILSGVRAFGSGEIAGNLAKMSVSESQLKWAGRDEVVVWGGEFDNFENVRKEVKKCLSAEVSVERLEDRFKQMEGGATKEGGSGGLWDRVGAWWRGEGEGEKKRKRGE